MAIDTSVVNIDFDIIRTNSCKSIRVLDLSHWANAQDDAAYIEIVTPGNIKPVTHVFQKDTSNVFNNSNLNMSDVKDYSYLGALPDGMYKFTVLQCQDDPYAVSKYFLQDCVLKCKIARKLISVDLTCEPCRKELLRDIQEIMLFMDAAQAQADKCNVNKAMEYYRRALLLLDRITDNPDNAGCINC